MIKTILVPVTGHKSDLPALEAAYRVGGPFQAVLECLEIHLGNIEIIRAVAVGQFSSDVSNTELIGKLQHQAREAQKAARATVERFRSEHAGDQSIIIEAREIAGDPVQQTIAYARYNDLLVLARVEDGAVFSTGDLGTILMACGRPVLLVPAKPITNHTSTSSVVIAWKDTAEAARAVTAAMPILHKAERIVVVTVEEDGGEYDKADAKAAAERLAAQLKKHGLNAQAQSIPRHGRPAPEAMLDGLNQLGADLLVMGAYGHSRAREMVFGGFTRHVLRSAAIPVFLFH
jgi:nucleotide-binding universal stress UspA family protein